MKWLNLLLTRLPMAMPFGFGSFVKSWVTGWKLYVLGIALFLIGIVATSYWKRKKFMVKAQAENLYYMPETLEKTNIAEKKVATLLKKSQSYEAKKDSLHLVIDKLDNDGLQWAVDTAFNFRQPP